MHERFRRFLFARYAPRGSKYSAADFSDPKLSLRQQQILKDARSAALAAIPWEGKPSTFAQIRLSPVEPVDDRLRSDWRDFIETAVGFTYARISPARRTDYQDYLRQLYGTAGALATAYQTDEVPFLQLELPGESDFPEDGRRLRDWIEFVSRVVPAKDAAHRFTVLVPTSPEESRAERRQRVERVTKVVAQEKPAHTQFDVKAFWELFRIGSARVGLDTPLGESSRYAAIIVGRDAVGDGFLAPAHPRGVTDRFVLGRDAPQETSNAL